MALGDSWREHELVFASSVGTPIEPRNVNRRWDELRRMAGLDWFRLHDYADLELTLSCGDVGRSEGLEPPTF